LGLSESDDDECMTEEQYQIFLREQAEESAKYDWDAINRDLEAFAKAQHEEEIRIRATSEGWRLEKIPRKYWSKTCFVCGASLKA
jgi:hypothetical protein